MGNSKKTENPNARWRQVKEEIEIGIVKETYSVGECIPSINQMCEMYGISSNTALRVLESLHSDNVVYKRAGKGYLVKPYAKEELIRKLQYDYEKKIADLVNIGLMRGYTKESITQIMEKVVSDM